MLRIKGLQLESITLMKAPSERCETTRRRSWNGLPCCLKKLRRRHFELLLNNLQSLRTCFASGLTACAMPNCLSRHLSPQPKRKALLPNFPFQNPILKHLGRLSIPESNFKTSWQWLSQFRAHRALQKMFLHGEGAEVNKNDLELLAVLKEFYEIITQYDPENVYNMDEIGLFFRLLPRNLHQMTIHDMFN